jgi:hypothetical protein
MKIITDWMKFDAEPLIGHWRRNGDYAEIQIKYVGKDFNDRYEAFADAMKNSEKDISQYRPAGLPNGATHSFEPVAKVKPSMFEGKWYGTVEWVKYVGLIEGWADGKEVK